MDKEKCSRCGYDKFKGALQIHHIDGNHENNAPENLMILCSNCHVEYHHNEKKLIKDKTIEGMRIARERGIVLGRPLKNIDIDDVKVKLASGIPKTRIASELNIHVTTLYKKLKASMR